MHDGGAGGGGSIPGGGHTPAHHPGQLSHGPAHHHAHDGLPPTGYDHEGQLAGITPNGRLSRRQAKTTGLSVIAVIVIIVIVLLVI